MSIVHECAQRSAAWYALRLGMPTASSFDKLITKTGKPSTQAAQYMNALLSEWMMAAPIEIPETYWMTRGQDLEPEAWRYYEMRHDIDVVREGFITDDQQRYGCSPDGRIYEGATLVGGVELKCPKPENHMGYLRDPSTMVDRYRHQVAGCLLITGAQWWDLMSYHPLMPAALVRVVPVDVAKYMESLAVTLGAFVKELAAEKQRLLDQGYEPRKVAQIEVEEMDSEQVVL